jgi:hypothetical protein
VSQRLEESLCLSEGAADVLVVLTMQEDEAIATVDFPIELWLDADAAEDTGGIDGTQSGEAYELTGWIELHPVQDAEVTLLYCMVCRADSTLYGVCTCR